VNGKTSQGVLNDAWEEVLPKGKSIPMTNVEVLLRFRSLVGGTWDYG